MLLSAHQIPWVKKKKEKLENAMDYSVTFCNVNFLRLWLELIRWIELLQLLSTKTCQSFCVKQSVRSVLCIILCILGDAIIAVAVESLIRIVREGKHDADLFIGKRYMQLVNFITELVPQKVSKKK